MTTAATAATAAAAARRAIEDVFAGRALKAFYVAVLAVALVGSTQGVENWIGWHTVGAFCAVLLGELGGVALSVFARGRQQKGERAVFSRLASAAFAAFAVFVQLRGHAAPGGGISDIGVFFASFSVAGYVVYLLDSAAQRRDALRAEGKLAEPPPVYGAYQWIRHPWVTRRARALAVANAENRLVERIARRDAGLPEVPTTQLLGRAASLAAAIDEIKRENSRDAMRATLRDLIAEGVDPKLAKLAVNAYDLDKLADGVGASANYPELTALIADRLTPDRIVAGITARRSRRWFRRRPETKETTPETEPAPVLPALSPVVPADARLLPVYCAASLASETEPETVETAPQAPETEPARVLPALVPAVPVVPADVRLLPVRCAASLAPAPPAPVDETSVQTEPEHAEPTPAGSTASAPAQRIPATEQNAPESRTEKPLPSVPTVLLPHLAKVMRAHPDWALTINLPSRHPEALTGSKVKIAVGLTGQQTISDIRAALRLLSEHEGAQAYVEASTPAYAMT